MTGDLKRVRLGRSELMVSPIAFGTWQLGGEWGQFDEQKAIEAIRHAHGLGIDLFDTAQAYGFGVSERLLAQALEDELREARDEVVIATKGGLRPVPGGVVRDSSPEFASNVAGQAFADFLSDPSSIDGILEDMQAQAEVIFAE